MTQWSTNDDDDYNERLNIRLIWTVFGRSVDLVDSIWFDNVCSTRLTLSERKRKTIPSE